jgi:hypothetical protein
LWFSVCHPSTLRTVTAKRLPAPRQSCYFACPNLLSDLLSCFSKSKLRSKLGTQWRYPVRLPTSDGKMTVSTVRFHQWKCLVAEVLSGDFTSQFRRWR